MEIEVKGHSGCSIDIVREGKKLFIYKCSEDPKYLDRLVKQAEKQQLASMYEYQHTRIPQIFSVDRLRNKVSVKMEYIYSKNFIGYFESAGFEQISYFIKALILFVEKELKESPMQIVATQMLLDKFKSVGENIVSNLTLCNDDEVNELFAHSLQIFQKIGYIEIPVGICHGDLNFSNILFNGNNYYLIDFLDSFIESPLMDIVKIRQDSAYMWSQLMYIHEYDRTRLNIISEKVDSDITAHFEQYNWFRTYYKPFQLMNFWRILQYAKEERVIVYLKQVIKSILYEF